MKPRHVCEDFRCPVCFPSQSAAYLKGREEGGQEAEQLFQKLQQARAEIEEYKRAIQSWKQEEQSKYDEWKELNSELTQSRQRIAALEAEQESWGNEFSAVCAMKEKVAALEAECTELNRKGGEVCNYAGNLGIELHDVKKELTQVKAECAGLRKGLKAVIENGHEGSAIAYAREVLSSTAGADLLERMRKFENLERWVRSYVKPGKSKHTKEHLQVNGECVCPMCKALDALGAK